MQLKSQSSALVTKWAAEAIRAAFVAYISPLQVNSLIPSDVATGLQQLTVKTAAGTSPPFNITINALEPGLLAPPSFNVNGVQYAVAFFGDQTYVLPTGAIAGLVSRPAKPGDVIVLYGIGFGPVTPDIPAGQLPEQKSKLTSSLEVFLGGIPATVQYEGLADGLTGIYQFNIVVPILPPGNAALTFKLDGTPGTQTFISPWKIRVAGRVRERGKPVTTMRDSESAGSSRGIDPPVRHTAFQRLSRKDDERRVAKQASRR